MNSSVNQMIEYLTNPWAIGAVILALISHFVFVKPLLMIRYYKKQGIKESKFVPIVGWTLGVMKSDLQKHNDVFHSQKSYLSDGRDCNAMITNFFGSIQLMLFDPVMIQDFYVNKNHLYEKVKLGQELSHALFGNGLFFQEGERWKRTRKITSALFNFNMLNTYIPLCESIVESQLASIKEGERVCLIDKFEAITGTISLSIFFGRTLEGIFVEGKPIVQLLKETQLSCQKLLVSPKFMLSGGKSLPAELRRVTGLYKDALNRLVVEELESLPKDSQHKTLVEQYAKEENFIGGKPPQQLVDDITSQILNFYLAARDTTSYHTLMLVYYMNAHPEIGAKVIAEINQLPKNQPLTWDDLKKLTYLDAVSKETHRVYGPALGLAGREATQDHTLGNVLIKKGTMVGPGIAANNFNPKYYSDPWTFKPERWIDGDTNNLNTFVYTPFSAGARNCIGQHFSIIMMKTLLVRLFQNYELTLDPDYKLKLEFSTVYGPIGGPFFTFRQITNQKTE